MFKPLYGSKNAYDHTEYPLKGADIETTCWICQTQQRHYAVIALDIAKK